jgi:hypothetical protein
MAMTLRVLGVWILIQPITVSGWMLALRERRRLGGN